MLRLILRSHKENLASMLEDDHFDVCGPVDLLLVSIAHDLVRLSEGGANV
jgi:hypothetical protein